MHHDPVRATFKGRLNDDGTPVEFHAGLPARDITESEYQAMSAEERAAVRASPLYDTKTDREVAGKPAAERAETPAPAPAKADKE